MMNNRIKVYAIILGVIYFFALIPSVLDGFEGGVEGFKSGYEAGRDLKEHGLKTEHFTVNVKPKPNEYYQENSTTSYKPTKLQVIVKQTEQNKSSLIYKISSGIIALVLIFVFIYIPILFYKIIRSIIAKGVFDRYIVKRVMRMGWLLLIVFAAYAVLEIWDMHIAKEMITLEHFEIVNSRLDFSTLRLGLLTLFLGEVLKFSLKMKEEQDLTV